MANFYRAMLVAYFAVLLGPLLFEIGVSKPAYVVTAWTWLTGLILCAVPAWLGYLVGRTHSIGKEGGQG